MSTPVKPRAEETLKTRPTLLSKIKRDDEDGWTRFHDLYWDFIYSSARAARLSHHESEDVVYETMVTVRKYIHSFVPDPDRAKFRTWLRKIVKCRIADVYRKKGNDPLSNARETERPAGDEEMATSTTNRIPNVTEVELDRLIDRRLNEAILKEARKLAKDEVSMENYQAYDLHDVQDVSAKEVARTLGINVVTVRVRAFRTRKEVDRQVKRIVKELDKMTP